jgi:quinoprotein dehydrogenase-associated probable ABC transporter substrate-binding protein
MSVTSGFRAAAALSLLLGSTAALAADQPGHAYVGGDKNFEDMSQAEKDTAKATARRTKIETLRVCADPGNMPFSDIHRDGYENKIIEAVAKAMGAKVQYAWRPTFERGLTRQPMTEYNVCDVMIDLPADYEALLMTKPIYRSTYVLAYRNDRGIDIKNLDDPALKKLRIGVYQTSGIRNALANHGIKNNVEVKETSHDADLVPEHQPWHQVEEVVDRKLDIAGTWGPFAGWLKATKHAPLTLKPTNLMDDNVPMEFSVAMGVHKYDAVLKYALDEALEKVKPEVDKIMAAYGVPLVQCSDCLVSGKIPAHGDYIIEQMGDSDEALQRTVISKEQLEKWLADGADPDEELGNAVLAADLDRVQLLLDKGANINKAGKDGAYPLHIAVNNGDVDMLTLLLDHKADIKVRDNDGYTPLAFAASRNKSDVISLLLKHGADIEDPVDGGYTPLFVAISEGKFSAARTLLEAGAKADVPEGPQHLTPLMAAATQNPPERRIIQVVQKVGPVDIAQDLIKRGANVNAATTKGVTPLMIAAAHDNASMVGLLAQSGANAAAKSADGQTALDIAQQNGNDSAARALKLFQKTIAN